MTIKYIILDKQLSEENKLSVDYGALVIRERLGEEAVAPGSAAKKAGLKEFDIILEVNGEKITEKNVLADILQKYKIGDKINLKLLRSKKEIELNVTLEEKK